MKPFRNIRVLPVVLVAICSLAVLKIAGLVLDGGYVFDYRPESTKPSWAQETFNFPGRSGTCGRFSLERQGGRSRRAGFLRTQKG